MKLYLDDERPTPEGWVRVYTAPEAISYLWTGLVTEVSLDHDLGEELEGYDVTLFIEAGAAGGWLAPLKWNVHSANPSWASRMNAALQSAERFWSNKKEETP